jgi:hypothetical protein
VECDVLARILTSTHQRVAEGATASTIAARAETPEAALVPSLERLAHPRVRLLEKPDPNHYRLPHERLVPVLRQLTGTVLASLDRLKLVFEDGFARWSKTGKRRNLLRGNELRYVLRNRPYFLQGDDTAQRTNYMAVCVAQRNLWRGIVSALALAVILIGFLAIRLWDKSINRERLRSWNIQPELLEDQQQLDSMDLSKREVNDLSWLHHDMKLKEVDMAFYGSSLVGIENLTALTSLRLNLSGAQLQNLAGLEKLTGLTSLTLKLGFFQRPDLAGLGKLTGLTLLTLDLGSSQVQNLAGLEKLTGLTSLTLNLGFFQGPDLAGLAKLTELTSLTLNQLSAQNLAGLEKLTGLTSLTLDLGSSNMENLAGLEKLTGLTSLTLDLGSSHIQNLAGLEKLKGLTSLTLSLGFFQGPAGLEKLAGLTSLTLNLDFFQKRNLAGLENLTKLKTVELHVPASMAFDEAGGMIQKRHLTKVIIYVSKTDRLRVPVGYKFVGAVFD